MSEASGMSGLDQSALPTAKALDLMSRKTPPMATCPRCPAVTPLISTMQFTGAEFYCLECGGCFGFLSPRAEPQTPELTEHYRRLLAEWTEHVGHRLLVEGRSPRDDEARATHDAAMAWLKDRRTR